MSFLKKAQEAAAKIKADAEAAFKANGGEQIITDAKAALDKTVTDAKGALKNAGPALEQTAKKIDEAAKKVEEVEGKIDEVTREGVKKVQDVIRGFGKK